MIFQEYVRECCEGRPGDAARLIEQSTGMPIGYHRAHRWFHSPAPIPLGYARAIVQATSGRCSLEELIDPEIIAGRFKFDDDPEAERKFVETRLALRQRELRQLEAFAKLGRTLPELRREVASLTQRLERLRSASPPAARKRGRPARDAAAEVAPSRRRRRRPASAAAA